MVNCEQDQVIKMCHMWRKLQHMAYVCNQKAASDLPLGSPYQQVWDMAPISFWRVEVTKLACYQWAEPWRRNHGDVMTSWVVQPKLSSSDAWTACPTLQEQKGRKTITEQGWMWVSGRLYTHEAHPSSKSEGDWWCCVGKDATLSYFIHSAGRNLVWVWYCYHGCSLILKERVKMQTHQKQAG